MHDAHQRARRADLGGEHVAAIAALEQEQLGAPHQRLFEREIEEPDRRRAAVVQAAAMRRVDANGPAATQPRISAALGAMTVQHVDIGFARAPCDMALCRQIAQAGMPAHGYTGKSQRELRRQSRKRRIRTRAAGRGVRHDAHLMAARGLRARKIDHVTKQTADG